MIDLSKSNLFLIRVQDFQTSVISRGLPGTNGTIYLCGVPVNPSQSQLDMLSDPRSIFSEEINLVYAQIDPMTYLLGKN